MTQDRKCAHAGCACPADTGSDYCSAQCQTADGSSKQACACQHEICRQGQASSTGGTADGSYDPAMSEQVKEKPLLDDWGKSDKH